MLKEKGLTGKLMTGVIFVLLLYTLPAASSAAAEKENPSAFLLFSEARIFINDLEMKTENRPLSLEGRLFLPGRFFLEALGARVEWNPATYTITAVWEQTRLDIPVGAQEVRKNGFPIQLDAPARIIAGRTFLPLRFLIELLGGTVYWDEKDQRVIATLDGAPAIPYLPGGLPPEYMLPPYGWEGEPDLKIETQGIRLGDTASRVLEVLGEPASREETIYGYQWWVYNQNPFDYLQVGIEDGLAVALYIYGEKWSFGPVKSGDRLQELEKHFEPADGLFLEENRTFYKFVRPTLIHGSLVATFYHDSAKEDALVALRLEKGEAAGKRLKNFFAFRSEKGDRQAFDSKKLQEAEASDERLLFYLVNAARSREGLSPLVWHEATARASRGHSREMYMFNYFSHTSPVSGKTLAQRLDAEKVDFSLATENIARGQLDAMEAHHDLMNSPRHRENILHRELLFLGVGVYGDCFTQNFVREK